MNPTIAASLITGSLALLGVIITNLLSSKAIEHKLETNQAVMDTKFENLAREVRESSSNVQQIPVMIKQIENLERRVDKIEDDGK